MLKFSYCGLTNRSLNNFVDIKKGSNHWNLFLCNLFMIMKLYQMFQLFNIFGNNIFSQ
jgi:hypothetical protein